MFLSCPLFLFFAALITTVHSYVDFGTVTAPVPCNLEPLHATPRPKFIPDDVFMRYEPFSSSIAAVAPSLRLVSNGTHQISWSLHFVQQPTRTVQDSDRGLRKRGVFSGDPPAATCRPCDSSGNPIDNSSSNNTSNGVPNCSVTNYDGVFRSGAPSTSSLPEYCFNAGYTGPLVPTPIPTEAGLPCCPVCYSAPTNNASFTATTGVFSSLPTTTKSRTSISRTSSSTRTTTRGGSSDSGKETVTITATATEPGTSTRITLSIETITPSAGGVVGSPVVTTAFNTIIGCGTASGCGTVIGSGTVYLPPFGFPGVTSSGLVSGCAPTVVGCGTMIATRGVFTAPPDQPLATITGCGEGTGSATLIGSGTVWPAGFMDMISFVSSGTVTGSGRVKGCGIITGRGTFTVSEPYTTTLVPSEGTTTINVYVSYCPPDPMNPLLRLAGNFSDGGEPGVVVVVDADGRRVDPSDPLYNVSAVSPGSDTNDRYALSGLAIGNFTGGGSNGTYLNSTSNSTTGSPLCHVCPEDSGICCPPYSDCGADGHCPWTALQRCGYARFGVNLVDVRNSSEDMGMVGLADGVGYGDAMARYRAPGLPGSKSGTSDAGNDGVSDQGGSNTAQKIQRGLMGRKIDHVRVHRIQVARVHGHGH